MRIEILVGSEDPVIYPLNKPKMVIGTDPSCEIVLSANGISRKHISVLTEGDNFYIIDQGSTNGSYLNEERLVPGRRVEFTSFFPIRLGDDVLISLLSDAETEGTLSDYIVRETSAPKTDPRRQDDATRAISLKSLQAAKTENLVARRQDVKKRLSAKRVPPPPPKEAEESRFTAAKIIAVILVAGAAFYTIFMREPEVVQDTLQVGQVRKIEQKPEAPKPPSKPLVVAQADLTSRESLMNLLRDIKCTTEMELYLCETIPRDDGGTWGVVQVGTMLNALVDATDLFKRARELHTKPIVIDGKVETEEEKAARYEKEVNSVVALLYVEEVLPDTLDVEKLKDHKLTYALFEVLESGPRLGTAIAFLPERINEAKVIIDHRHIEGVKNSGPAFLVFTKDFYVNY